jgi:hypothetical protein
MLREISRVKQEGPNRRRWFRDDWMDLFTWQTADGTVTAFQLCYDLSGKERALVWNARSGYSHDKVDGGEAVPNSNRSPILRPDGVFPAALVLQQFDVRAEAIEPALRDALRARITAYVDKLNASG